MQRNENLGKEARDSITGFEGTIVGYAQYLTGCDLYLLSPKCKKEELHEKPKSQWFDAPRVEILPGEKIVFDQEVESVNDNGSDIPAPKK